jgi:tetratricopeptide (TPR) repeat protein
MVHKSAWFALGVILMSAILLGLYQVPLVRFHLEWRFDAMQGIVRGWLGASDALPTPSGGVARAVTLTAAPISTTGPPSPTASTPMLTPTTLPAQVSLAAPEWEKQDWNNCGPATLSLALRFWGWTGDQYDISDLLKPDRGDKNVNVEELIYYVRTRAGWLNADYRAGGTLDSLRRFIAAGYPVIVEEGYIIEEGGGGWAAHYLLLTGYDDTAQVFVAQDSNRGPDVRVEYAALDAGWQDFNRVFIYLHPPEDQAMVDSLLGVDSDPVVNRERALEAARAEIGADPQDAFAWANLGLNLVYFERYAEAAEAYDTALTLGLPWRFTRYQFGPYIAYFHQGRFQDIVDLADATLYRTSKAEESMLWRGWARYRLGDRGGAIEDFRGALEINPNYLDAQYALDFVGSMP